MLLLSSAAMSAHPGTWPYVEMQCLRNALNRGSSQATSSACGLVRPQNCIENVPFSRSTAVHEGKPLLYVNKPMRQESRLNRPQRVSLRWFGHPIAVVHVLGAERTLVMDLGYVRASALLLAQQEQVEGANLRGLSPDRLRRVVALTEASVPLPWRPLCVSTTVQFIG